MVQRPDLDTALNQYSAHRWHVCYVKDQLELHLPLFLPLASGVQEQNQPIAGRAQFHNPIRRIIQHLIPEVALIKGSGFLNLTAIENCAAQFCHRLSPSVARASAPR